MAFQALLSYAREDAGTARWLLRRANGFRTPWSLTGTRGDFGPIQARIKLTPAERAHGEAGAWSFEESQALIVVCNAAAAGDAQVNRDVDAFVSRGRMRLIVPVIAPNAPPADDVERAFFPPALCGRGLFTIDLRERRLGDVLTGDGREGGWLKLAAALLGVDVARLAQQQGRRQSARTAMFAVAALIGAGAAVAAAGYAQRLQASIDAVAAQRQHAEQNAMRQVQLRREALAAAEQQAAAQASTVEEFSRAKNALLAVVRDTRGMADPILAEAREARAATPAMTRTLAALERSYWDIADASPYFEIRPTDFTGVLEQIAATYAQLGRTEDAARVHTRLVRLGQRVAQDRTAEPAWRSAFAAALVGIAQHRTADSDEAGANRASATAARIYDDVCMTAQAGASAESVRAQACLRFVGLVLARARETREAGEAVDLSALARAHTVLDAAIAAFPGNADLQARASRLIAQVEYIQEHPAAEETAAAAAPSQ